MTWKRYFSLLVGVPLILFIAGGAANYVLDSSGLYSGRVDEQELDAFARMLLSSPHGVVMTTQHERSKKLALAKATDADCFVTGSSHEMQLDRDTMPVLAERCGKVANVAVSGGSFEDFITASAVIHANPHARRIFVGIGPWALRMRAESNWTEQMDRYFEGRKTLGLKPDKQQWRAIRQNAQERLANVFNGAYLRRNLEVFVEQGFTLPSRPTATLVSEHGDNLRPSEAVWLASGRLQHSRRGDEQARAPKWEDIQDGGYKLSGTPFDPATEQDWELALKKLKDRGIEVNLLLMPYHPKIFGQTSSPSTTWIVSVESRIRALAERVGVSVIGSYDSRVFGLTHDDFRDVMHMSVSSVGKVR